MDHGYLRKAELYASIKCELDNEQKIGVLLTVEGLLSTPEHIASLCVFREDCNYMRDYIIEDGKLVEICFNNVYNR